MRSGVIIVVGVFLGVRNVLLVEILYSSSVYTWHYRQIHLKLLLKCLTSITESPNIRPCLWKPLCLFISMYSKP